MTPRTIAMLLLSLGCLRAQESEVPLRFNLPSAAHLEGWDVGVAFTHRFLQSVKGSGKDAYGLDGYAYAGVGLTMGIAPVKGLNAFIYRTADNKTFIVGLQERLIASNRFRLDLRVERFDEVVTHREVVSGEVGIVGGTVSLPMDLLLGPWTLGLVPGYVSTTATRQVDFSTSPTGRLSTPRKGVFNAGAAVRYEFPGDLSLFGEFVPKPARLPGTYRSSFALGLTYRTQRHRFTLAGTNASGSTLNQILAGDHAGGPRDSGQWSLGFNLVRVF